MGMTNIFYLTDTGLINSLTLSKTMEDLHPLTDSYVQSLDVAKVLSLHAGAMTAPNGKADFPDYSSGKISAITGQLRTTLMCLADCLGLHRYNINVLRALLEKGATDGFTGLLEVVAAYSHLLENKEFVMPSKEEAITVKASTVPETMPFAASATSALAPSKVAILEMMAAALASGNGDGMSREEVIKLIEEHAPRPAEKTITVVLPSKEKKLGEKLVHHKFDAVLKAVANDVPVMLVGPAGSGKTTLCEQVAKALDKRFYFTGAVASEYKLSGFVDAQGRIVSTAFREAYKNGGLFLFDEVDASMPQAIMAFNAALANGHCDFPGDVEPTKRHEDFRVVAAANTYGRGADRQYVGRNQLDAASLDRFAVIEMDYDETLEKALAGNEQWTKRVQRIRKEIEKQQVRHIVSPRASIMGAKLLAAGFSIDEALEAAVWKGLDKETKARIASAAA